MIPILFWKNELNFTTNGIGRLTDCISCSVKEEINGEYTLSMTYPVNGIHFEDIKVRNYIYVKPNQKSNNQAFRITKISRPINGQVTISAEHISYLLGKIVIRPYLGKGGEAYDRLRIDHGAYLHEIINDKINDYIQPEDNRRFTFYADVKAKNQWPVQKGYYIANDGNYTENQKDTPQYELKKPIDVKSFLSDTGEDSIRGIFNLNEEDDDYGEFEFDMFNVYLRQSRGGLTDVVIKYGRNLTDLTYEDDISESYSAAIPFYTGSTMTTSAISDVIDMRDRSPDPDYIWYETDALDLTSDNVIKNDPDVYGTPSPQYLTERATRYMQDEKVWITKDSLNISFIDLWNTLEYNNFAPIQLLGLGDELAVQYVALGVNVNKRIMSYEYDVLVERYSSVTLGDPRDDMTRVISRINKETYNTIYETSEKIGNLEYQTNSRFEVNETYIESSVQQMEIVDGVIQYKVGTNIEQTPTKISFSVDGEELSKNTSAGIIISVDRPNGSRDKTVVGTIKMSGQVVFENDLSSTGTTIIDGGRIKTGTIEGITIISSNGSNRINLNNGVISIWDNNGFSHVGSIHYAYYNGSTGASATRRRGMCLETQSDSAWIGFANAGTSDYGEWGKYNVIVNTGGLLPYLDGATRSQSLLVKGGIYSKESIYCYNGITGWNVYCENDLYVDGQIHNSGSSRKIKHDIRPVTDPKLDPNKLYSLEVVQFKYNEPDRYATGHRNDNMIGFIAEDVAEVYPVAARYRKRDPEKNDSLEMYNWDERSIIAASVKLLQDQHKIIEEMRSEIEFLKGEIDILKQQINSK